ncbi:MAG: DUF4157 domain-containing protein, partial [Candidatus Udaeobacter sp.]
PSHGHELESEAPASASPRFAHDFSGISLHARAPAILQAKFQVNTPGDTYEQEADRVAEEVMRMPEPQLQRTGADFGEDSGRWNPQAPSVSLRTKSVQASNTGEMVAPSIVHEVLRSSGQPLDPTTRAFMEPRFGHYFAKVRIHNGPQAATAAASIQARAFTLGRDVVFAAAEHDPRSEDGKRLLAHELMHVVQQSGEGENHVCEKQALQRKKVPTDFGEFETTKFAEADGRGVEIILKFSPDDTKVDAKKIALSQSIRETTARGADYALDPNAATKMVPSGKSGAGYGIDALAGTTNPLYGERNTLGPAHDLKDTPASANKTADPVNLGVNTNYELGYCYKDKPADVAKKKHPAALWDKPLGGKNKGESKTFETVALAIEGTDKDKYYGSVKWGYKMEGTDAAPTVTKSDIESASVGTPTVNFIEPAKLWNVGKTLGTVQVTADPEATVLKGDASGTEKLVKDTKLKQLETAMWGTDPAIKAEVLKADGTGSGKIIYIKNTDAKDAGDGSTNKKLPT